MRNAIRAGVASAVLVTALALITPTPASAHGWTEPNAWSGGHTLGVSHLDRGSVVALWQRMVHVQFGGGCPGLHGCTYKTDGIFGQNTRNRTILWQAVYRDNLVPGLAVDGIVGPQTWNAARFFNLVMDTGSNPNVVYYDYGPNDSVMERGFSMVYVPGYATWLAEGWECEREIIDHPTVRHTWLQACW